MNIRFIKWEEKQFVSILEAIEAAHPEIMQEVMEREDTALPARYRFNSRDHFASCFEKAIQQIVAVLKSNKQSISLLSFCSEKGANLLHIAADLENASAAKILLEHEAESSTDLNKKVCKDGRECTALELAAFQGSIKLVRFLLDKGAEGNFTDMFCSAAYHHRSKLMQLLLEQEWNKDLDTPGSFIDDGREHDGVPISLATQGLLNLFIGSPYEEAQEEGIKCIVLLLKHNVSLNPSYKENGVTKYREGPLEVIAKYRYTFGFSFDSLAELTREYNLSLDYDCLCRYERCLLNLLVVSGADRLLPASDGRSIKDIRPSIDAFIQKTESCLNEKMLERFNCLEEKIDVKGEKTKEFNYGRLIAWCSLSIEEMNGYISVDLVVRFSEREGFQKLPQELRDEILAHLPMKYPLQPCLFIEDTQVSSQGEEPQPTRPRPGI